MGNKQSSKRRESQIVRPNLAAAVNPSLPPEAVNTLADCLNKLPITLDKRVRDEVIRRVELIQTAETPEILLRKGHEPSGIHVLVSGNVNTVSENEKFILREIQAGDCFGEVSVLFNMKCTADVKTVDRCVILLLRTSDARQLFTFPSEVTLLQWFQQRRYFDTSKLFDNQQLPHEIALDVLQKRYQPRRTEAPHQQRHVNHWPQLLHVSTCHVSSTHNERRTPFEAKMKAKGKHRK